jgi:hypothetical protein
MELSHAIGFNGGANQPLHVYRARRAVRARRRLR